MAYWNIDTAHGTSLSEGIQTEKVAREAAQRTADRLGESVYLYEVGRDLESEEVKPETDHELEGEDPHAIARMALFSRNS